MKYKNATDLTWIPWFRYALLLRINAGQIISLGRFRLAISAHLAALRLKELRGYEPRVVDTKECEFMEFCEAYKGAYYEA